jgi:hypothetical protein
MEFVAGQTLKELADRIPTAAADEALAWFHGIAAGVAYLHDRGIVHRDLKPGNIFATKAWSRSATTACRSSSRAAGGAGTPRASARSTTWRPRWPTAATARRSTSTPWAWSCTRCSRAGCPFDGESVGEVLMKHLTAEPDLSPLAEPYRSVIPGVGKGPGPAVLVGP